MNSMDSRLPTLLRGAGAALFVVFLLAAGLSLDNPVSLIVLLVTGIALGLVIYSMGFLVEQAALTAEARSKSQADIRAQTKAVLELVEALREATTEE